MYILTDVRHLHILTYTFVAIIYTGEPITQNVNRNL
jgi:hypothetical protein